LHKEGPDKEGRDLENRIPESLKIAERFLEEARGNLKMGYNEGAELLAYNAAFHCARALLFSKGFTERSHACLIIALNSVFKDEDELKEVFIRFDQFRLSRHNVQYSGELVDPETAEAFVKFASEFYGIVKKRFG
jgi:uncharacterized protein (UPF0332 family)